VIWKQSLGLFLMAIKNDMKKIAFYSNQLCLRGTETALFAYADYNEKILGNKSVIFSLPDRNLDALPKFQKRFEVNLMHFYEYEKYLKENNFDFLYIIKAGDNDGYCVNSIPTIVHAVFRINEPHGYKYVYASDWLCEDQGYSKETHSLPHICEKLPDPKYNLREILDISNDDIVFGYYGGSTEFNIEFVKDAIRKISSERNDIKFIFMNIDKFVDSSNVIFLPGTYDLDEKSAFVNTCDAMIHARYGGETFGLAVSEFALCNKPIITYELSAERSHIEILAERGIYYKDYDEVYNILTNLKQHVLYNDYFYPYLHFSPDKIMKKFQLLLH
jgi:glycosyltransferase involved in cell wall biosynthesis